MKFVFQFHFRLGLIVTLDFYLNFDACNHLIVMFTFL